MSFKSPADIANSACATATSKCSLRISQMLFLGFLAGAYIGFGGFLYTVVTQDLSQYVGLGLSKLVGGASFTVGLMLVIIAGGELFTGNCLIPIGALAGCVTLKEILKNWIIVYFANLIGSLFLAYLIYRTGLAGDAVGSNALKIASGKMSLPFGIAFFRGILCNWLVVLAVWMAMAAEDIVSKIFAIFFPIMAFVASGFEHSIANMYFMALGILLKNNEGLVSQAGLTSHSIDALSVRGFLNNIIPVTLGNIIGGVLFVAVFYYLAYKDKIKA
ncbi:formate/nitrite transporter family protein [Acetomicrobium sp. UBA5826]|uniref:formate/nitrite transporter family protein n=1 Tax=Acetomicrobium sp. UBA5826 TaxID=1946039 RepID=UPI00257A769B|nr:formate/nitrite transporter family protein [Acetomicrobium sp. UBA5826]